MHGSGLSPLILGESCERLVQMCVRHPSNHTALLGWGSYRARMHHSPHIAEGKLLIAPVSAACSGSPRGVPAQLSVKFRGAMMCHAPDSSSSPQ